MTSTVVVRSVSGVLFEMDVPAAGHARELWDEKIRKGDLVLVDAPVEWVKVGKVSRLQLAATASDAPRRGRPPKVQAPAESAAEVDVPDEE